MQIEEFLGRLSKVRKSGPNKWTACCPAHPDRSPSLSICELPDGRVLLHDFGGCGTDAVLGALGLAMTDLFPERLGDFSPQRGVFSASDALRGLAFESSVVAIAAADLAEGRRVDASRVCVAAGRIAEALELVHGRY